jgi:hypothetical protein
VVAEGDDRDTGAQQADRDLRRDTATARRVLAVDDDKIDPAFRAQRGQPPDDGFAPRLADDIA